MPEFSEFKAAFPQNDTELELVPSSLVNRIEQHFGIAIPEKLVEFWGELGGGYFGDRELLFFGEGGVRNIFSWNEEQTWGEIFPRPENGGPFFFAETCFGDQIGFRWKNGKPIIVLFVINVFESYIMTDDCGVFFEEILGKNTEIFDRSLFEKLRGYLGKLSTNCHYAPIVSFLVGGSDARENFHQEPARVHLITTLATFRSIKQRQP